MNTTTLKIEGMNCASCAERITKVVEREPGVRDAAVSFAEGQASIRFNPASTNEGRLIEVVEQAGFTVVRD